MTDYEQHSLSERESMHQEVNALDVSSSLHCFCQEL